MKDITLTIEGGGTFPFYNIKRKEYSKYSAKTYTNGTKSETFVSIAIPGYSDFDLDIKEKMFPEHKVTINADPNRYSSIQTPYQSEYTSTDVHTGIIVQRFNITLDIPENTSLKETNIGNGILYLRFEEKSTENNQAKNIQIKRLS